MATIKAVMKGPNEVLSFNHPFIEYPQLASIKMDGFRLLNLCGEHLLSPALKPFPNRNMTSHMQAFLDFCQQERIVTDGEFWSPTLTFQQLQSIVRSHNATIPSDVQYHIFDIMSENEWNCESEQTFVYRYLNYKSTLAGFEHVRLVEQWHIIDAGEAETFFNEQIELGQEGMILRSPNAKYKHGRTTIRQDGMWKFKEFLTHDAIIVGIEQGERMREGIVRTLDGQGKLERTYRQDDYELVDMVGAFWVEQDGLRFKVKPGKGHDNSWKRDVWNNRESLLGKHLEYKFMPHGTMDKPRIGNLVRLRPDLD